MSLNPTAGSTSSTTTTPTTTTTTTTATGQPDYLSLLGGLSPLPFDPNTVVNALLATAQAPITNLQSQISNIQNYENIYKSIGADVSNVESLAFNLTLQSNVQANTATSSSSALTATASPTALAGTYSVAINSLATSTMAASTGGIGAPIDQAAAASTALASLNLRGTVTAGTFSVVVDGKVQQVAVDTTKALLDPSGALTGIQNAIAAGLGVSASNVTVGMVNDTVQIGLSGLSGTHSISFGASGDSSNFLSLMGLDTVQGSNLTGTASLTGATTVGVAQPTATLNAAGLGTALNASSGSFSINGVSISWDATADSLADVINRINTSNAGVTAQYNSVTDGLTLTNKATGQVAMTLSDTSGNFLAAMNLAPGTINAQTLGSNASVTVNGTTVSSTSNTIKNALPGVSITATAQTPAGSPATITVGPDTAGITKRVQDFVDAINKTLSDIDLTQQKDSTSGQYSQLLGDQTLMGLKNWLINTVTGVVTTSGSYQSLQDIGITTGTVGSAPGTTNSLTLDTTKLSAAIAASPSAVAALFSGTTASNGFQGVAQTMNTYLMQMTNPINGPFAQYQTTGDSTIKSMQQQITQLQDGIAQQRTVMLAQFTAMSNALSLLSAQASIFNSSSASSTSSSSGH